MLRRSMLWRHTSAGLADGERVLAAVSGGADSVALLHLVLPDDPKLRKRLLVAYVHHSTGAHADEAAKFVKRLARDLGLEFRMARIEVDEKFLREMGFEAAARQERYRALERIADETGCVRLLTAHTLDDQAESVLLALMRGAGTGGVAGVRENRGRWKRPLLTFSREALRQFLHDEDIDYLDDPANEDMHYARVRVRKHFRPLVIQQFGEGAWRNIALSARRFAEADESLEKEARRVLAEVERGSIRRWIAIDASGLGGYFADVRSRTLVAAYAHAAGIEEDVVYLTRQDRRKLAAMLRAHPGDCLELPGVTVRRTEARLVFDGLADTPPLPWKLPGELRLPDGSVVHAERREWAPGETLESTPGFVEVFDAERLGGDVTLRPWREGDRFDPLGRPGRDVKVKRALRRISGERIGPLWVLESGETIAWVLGERIADPFKVRNETRSVWTLTFEPALPPASPDDT